MAGTDELDQSDNNAPKSVIFMIADGMGLSNVTLARTFLFGPRGDRLSFESLPYIGYQRTSSINSFVTDSGAGASAWASGEKFKNGEISCRDADGDGQCDGTRKNLETPLELAESRGMATGLVATSDITHATPAAWGAHVHERKCGTEIFRQFLDNDIDVLLGGGIAFNRKPCLLDDTDAADIRELIDRAEASGYSIIHEKKDLITSAGLPKVLGLFRKGGLTPIFQREEPCPEPTLTEMTRAALTSLEKDPDGFFLVVEGSQIDWANHARNPQYLVPEIIDFHHAVESVRIWISEDSRREKDTLLIVTADHDTGGMMITGPYGSQPETGNMNDLEIHYENKSPGRSSPHTATDTIIWSNNPACGAALENTDLFYIMKNFLETNDPANSTKWGTR